MTGSVSPAVYVLDTGVRTSHLDFSGRVGDGVTVVGNSMLDDNGHGTLVAGTAMGSVYGVAPSAILHPVKVHD
jgi:subtilisin family serine protease